MTSDTILRVLIGVLFAGVVAMVVRYRLRAQGSERYDLGEEGMAIAIPLRLAGLAVWLYLPLFVLFPRLMAWSSVDLPVWLRFAALAFAGLVVPPFVRWAQSSLGDNVSPTVATKQDHQLVTSGPYRYIRHPLYTAGTAFFVSMALAAGSWFLLLLLAITAPFLLARTQIEEAKLIERFGDDYREYMQRTGRFLPRLRRSPSGSPRRDVP